MKPSKFISLVFMILSFFFLSTFVMAQDYAVMEIGNKNVKLVVAHIDENGYQQLLPAKDDKGMEKKWKKKLDLGDEFNFVGQSLSDKKIDELKTTMSSQVEQLRKSIFKDLTVHVYVSGMLAVASEESKTHIKEICHELSLELSWSDESDQEKLDFLSVTHGKSGQLVMDAKKDSMNLSMQSKDDTFLSKKLDKLGFKSLFKKYIQKSEHFSSAQDNLLQSSEFSSLKEWTTHLSEAQNIYVLGDSQLAQFISGKSKLVVDEQTHLSSGLIVTRAELDQKINELKNMSAKEFKQMIKNKDSEEQSFELEKVLPLLIVYSQILELSGQGQVIFVERSTAEGIVYRLAQ